MHDDNWVGEAAGIIPEDSATAALAGRVWDPQVGGPSVVALRGNVVVDVSAHFPTARALCEADDPAASLRSAHGPSLGTVSELVANTMPDTRDTELVKFSV